MKAVIGHIEKRKKLVLGIMFLVLFFLGMIR
jgi:hypothetical protein